MGNAESDIRKAASLKYTKADVILAEYFVPDLDNYDQIKIYADSEQARIEVGGQRPRDLYRNDIIRYLQENELYNYVDLLNFCNKFLNEIWSAYKIKNEELDQSSKAYVIYELTSAICTIYKETNQKELFNELSIP
jgi:hypothetical protein